MESILKLDTKGTFKLTKTGSKRDNSRVYVGESIKGDLTLHNIKSKGKQILMFEVHGRGFNYIRTSPIVKVVDQTKDTILFETEGGHYKLERVDET